MRARLTAAFAAAVAVTATMAFQMQGAYADNFSQYAQCAYGTEEQPCRLRQDRDMTMSYHLTTRLRSATEATRTQSYETTSLVTHLTDDTSAELIYYVNDNLSNNYAGLYTCTSQAIQGGYCVKAKIEYHGDLIGGYSDASLMALACHETGHGVGLRHSSLADQVVRDEYQCVKGGNFYPYRFLGSHNVAHINGFYNIG